MSTFRKNLLAVALSTVFIAVAAAPALATFHLMQIEQVIGGVNGDKTAQAIQLRMRAAGQNLVSGARLQAWDAAGANPVLVMDMAANVINFAAGSRVLIASASFVSHTTTTGAPDFLILPANVIPPSYFAAGSLTFEDDIGTIYWRLSWGLDYAGSGLGDTANDLDGDFNPPFVESMPVSCTGAIQFLGPFTAMSTMNITDYDLSSAPATFVNNNGDSFVVKTCTVDGDCIDGLTCTTDAACMGGCCVFTHNDSFCDDSNPCTGVEVCDPYVGCDLPPGHCDDGVTCTDDTCSLGICVFTPNNANCPSNGFFCDGEETCIATLGCVSSGDPCAGTAEPFCDEASNTCVTVPPTPPILWDPAGRATRTLTMSVPPPATASGGAGTSALQITMVDLQHPAPRNRPQYPPPNFTAFDTTVNGVCSGAGTPPHYNGHHCDTSVPDCVGPNNGISTDDGTCGSLQACTAAGEANGCVRWVGPVATFREKQDVMALGIYKAARLQCTPYYRDWTTEGVFTVFGAELLPSSTYEGRTFGSDCKGAEATCVNVSPPVTMITRRSADVVAPFNPGTLPETDQPDGGDVVAVLNKFKGLVGSPSNRLALLQPNAIDPNADVSGSDIVATVDAYKGLPYPYSGPCVCPSTVICGAVECPLNSCGAGVCVKTCSVGPGSTNAGLPCVDNTHDHCPGGTCPASGFCRDRCGRCN